jgi:hypothetical protein
VAEEQEVGPGQRQCSAIKASPKRKVMRGHEKTQGLKRTVSTEAIPSQLLLMVLLPSSHRVLWKFLVSSFARFVLGRPDC